MRAWRAAADAGQIAGEPQRSRASRRQTPPRPRQTSRRVRSLRLSLDEGQDVEAAQTCGCEFGRPPDEASALVGRAVADPTEPAGALLLVSRVGPARSIGPPSWRGAGLCERRSPASTTLLVTRVIAADDCWVRAHGACCTIRVPASAVASRGPRCVNPPAAASHPLRKGGKARPLPNCGRGRFCSPIGSTGSSTLWETPDRRSPNDRRAMAMLMRLSSRPAEWSIAAGLATCTSRASVGSPGWCWSSRPAVRSRSADPLRPES
jgi:hypothetical protein